MNRLERELFEVEVKTDDDDGCGCCGCIIPILVVIGLITVLRWIFGQ